VRVIKRKRKGNYKYIWFLNLSHEEIVKALWWCNQTKLLVYVTIKTTAINKANLFMSETGFLVCLALTIIESF
jgi:hypothetical protein